MKKLLREMDVQSVLFPGQTTFVVPEGIQELDFECFKACTQLETIVLPDSVTTIGQGAFSYCESLTDISLPEGVKEIGKAAFKECRSMKMIRIPDSVIEIGDNAFEGCVNLKTASIPYTLAASDEQRENHYGFDDGVSVEIRCPEDLYKQLKLEENKMKDWHVITESADSYPQKPKNYIDEEKNEWITVAIPVIVTTADKNVFACYYDFSVQQDGKGAFWYGSSENVLNNVIAWMLMPKAYDENQEE